MLSFLGIPIILLASSICGTQTLTYSCLNASVDVTLNNDDGNQFIIVPSCTGSSNVGTMQTLSHCSENFTNGMIPGYLFHETGNISEVRTFTINCKNKSDGNASISVIQRNITIIPLPHRNMCNFNLMVEGGNNGYYLGQEMKVILTATGPYNITAVKCIASSPDDPGSSIVLSENGITQQQYLLTNFSSSCNNTLTATMYAFRFVHSNSISLTCTVKPCGEHLCSETFYTEDADDAWHSEDKAYLGLLYQPTMERTVTVVFI